MIPSNMTIDYTIVAADGKDAGRSLRVYVMIASYLSTETFLKRPILKNLKKHDRALFVSEAKSKDVSLENQVPQAICKMYACAITLGSVAYPLESVYFASSPIL